MSGRGFIAMKRGFFDHPIFAAEPYTEREAFQWLIEQCAFKETRTRVGGALFELKRGQCVFAMRFMAQKWRWSEASVRRLLKKLQNDAMLELKMTRHATLITVCNYDKHQGAQDQDDAQNDADDVTKMTQKVTQRRTNKQKKDGAAAPTDSLEKQFFDRGRQLLGENAGGLIASLLKKKGGDLALARAALETAATKSSPKQYIGAILVGGTASPEGRRLTNDEEYYGVGRQPGIV